MNEIKEKVIRLIDFDEILKIINLIGLTENIKNIFIQNIEINDKIYTIKKEEICDAITHDEKIETIINCDDGRELSISFYSNYYSEKNELNIESNIFKVSYLLPQNNLIVFYLDIEKIPIFLENKHDNNSSCDILYNVLKYMTIDDLVKNNNYNDSKNNIMPRYYVKEEKYGFRPLTWDLKLIELEVLKEDIKKKNNYNNKYTFIENYDIEKEKISSLINDKNYSFNEVTIDLLNELKNSLLEKKREIEKELGCTIFESERLTKLKNIENSVNIELKKYKFNKEELSKLYNYLQESIERIERRQTNNRNKLLIKKQK